MLSTIEVSVRELKNNLSKYLQLVKAKGAALVVTSHHVPLAKVIGLPALPSAEQQSLLKVAGILWNGKKPTGYRKAPKLAGKTAAEYVLEDRR